MRPLNELLCGESLSILKNIDSDYFDLGITSPPYNKQFNQGGLVKKVDYDVYVDNISENSYQNNQIEVLNEIYRTIKPGGSFFYNHKCRWDKGNMIHPIVWLTKTKWVLRQEIIWDRKLAANLRGWRFWPTDERIYWLYKPLNGNKIGKEMKSTHPKLTSIWSFPPERNNPHPAPFPIEIPTRIIHSIFDNDLEDKIVLDPFIGSGTTAIASKVLGCNYVGIDISENYISMSNENINRFTDYVDKINRELSKHTITGKTYKQRKSEKLA